jgi:hypothetical protein
VRDKSDIGLVPRLFNMLDQPNVTFAGVTP